MNARLVWFLVLMMAGAAVATRVGADNTRPSAGGGKAASAAFKTIDWNDLAPKDWDAFKRFQDANLGGLSDNNPEAQKMLNDMRAIWDNAPTVSSMNGAAVKLAGYIVPLEEPKAGLKEFLLVPYFGACIHTPPPPANQIVHVVASKPVQGFRTMDAVWVSGTLKTVRQESVMGTSGYQMQVEAVDRYEPPKRP